MIFGVSSAMTGFFFGGGVFLTTTGVDTGLSALGLGLGFDFTADVFFFGVLEAVLLTVFFFGGVELAFVLPEGFLVDARGIGLLDEVVFLGDVTLVLRTVGVFTFAGGGVVSFR